MIQKKLEVTNISEITAFLNACHVIRMGFISGDFPYVVPSNYGFNLSRNGSLSFFVHGSSEGFKSELMRRTNNVGIEIDDGGRYLTPEEAQDHTPTYAYSSLMGFGKLNILSSFADKKRAMETLLKHESGNEAQKIMNEVTNSDIETVFVCRIEMVDYSMRQNHENGKFID